MPKTTQDTLTVRVAQGTSERLRRLFPPGTGGRSRDRAKFLRSAIESRLNQAEKKKSTENRKSG